jgi:hypothetical protein
VLNAESGSVYYERALQFASGTTAVLGDVDGDGKLEAVCPDHSASYEMHAISFDTNTTEWNFYGGYYMLAVPVLEDIDSDGKLEAIIAVYNSNIYAVDITPSGSEIGWQGDSGDNAFHRWRNKEYVPSQFDQIPVCTIELQKDGTEITEVDITDQFDINVEGSYDDNELVEVRFGSDDEQNGLFTGTWTSWYDWDISSGYWDATEKELVWSFNNGGYKEIWVEVKDNSSKIGRSNANIVSVYNITKDPRFMVSAKKDKTNTFGEIEFTLRFYELKPKSDMNTFKNALESWGIQFHHYDKVHTCWLLELGDFNELFNYLELKVPSIFTPSLRSNLELYVSNDGYVRLAFTTMSDLEDLNLNTLWDLFEFFLKAIMHMEMIKIPYELFEQFKNFFEVFFKTCVGSNQYITRLRLKEEFLSVSIKSLMIKIMTEATEYFNLELTLLKVNDIEIQALKSYSLKQLSDTFEILYDTFKLATKVVKVIITGFTNVLAWINLIAKGITYTLDYYFHYEAGKDGTVLDKLYAIADFVDPPVARLDLQIRNAQTNEVLLGYDPLLNETRYACDYGFYIGNLESQFVLIDPSIVPLNICIINTHLDTMQPPIYLNQSLIFGLTNRSDSSYSFSYLQSGDQFSAVINYSVSDGLTYNITKLEMVEISIQWTIVKVMDQNNNSLESTTIKAFFADQQIPIFVNYLGNGLHNLTFPLNYSDTELMITVEKEGYLSNSIYIVLGEWVPLEQPNPSTIPFSLIPILIIAFLSIGVILIKIKIKLKNN